MSILSYTHVHVSEYFRYVIYTRCRVSCSRNFDPNFEYPPATYSPFPHVWLPLEISVLYLSVRGD